MEREIIMLKTDNIFAILIVSMGIAFGIYGYLLNNTINQNHKSVVFLCIQKENLKEKVKSTQNFLDNGGHIPGVPNSLLIQGQTRDKITLKAMKVLDCP